MESHEIFMVYDNFAAQMRKASLAHLAASEVARRDLAENYIGLPY
jgi:p-hydroxybenzoate 3-monooxygenase